jgi:hypothetical protein
MSLWRRNQTRHDSVGTSSSSSNGSHKSSVSSRKPLFSGFVVKIDEDEPRPKSTLRKVQSLENHRSPMPPLAADLKELPPPPAPFEMPRPPLVEMPRPPLVETPRSPLVEMPRQPLAEIPRPPPVEMPRLPPPAAPVEPPRELPPPPVLYDVAIIGAGPAGLMLA